MTKHTPGPWRNGDPQMHIQAGNILAVRNRLVANCLGFASNATDTTVEENLANARLIAAAPDLYEAAKAALSVCEDAFTASNLHYEIREEEGGEGYLCVFCGCFSPEGDRHTDDCPATEELSWKAAVALRAAIAKAEGVQ